MNRCIEIIIAVLVLLSMFTGCYLKMPGTVNPEIRQEDTSAPASEPPRMETESSPTSPSQTDDEIDLKLREMTLKEKVGQLLVVLRPDALDLSQTAEQIKDSSADGVKELSSAMAAVLDNYPVGGIAMFGKNISTPDQITAFINNLQNSGNIPLFMAIDEEGGLVARIADNAAFNVRRYKSAAAVGESGDTAAAAEMGQTIGTVSLHQYRIQFGFCPGCRRELESEQPYNREPCVFIGFRRCCKDGKSYGGRSEKTAGYSDF